ncbi:PI-PLC X domain-containing protein 3 [Neocloeon triangulifer]|uniref:PI-PLC X domain-containing protein 3 n=1 Tax=Neocloeon triangulifer TaxID=2078957 RepID=UPI00286F31DC|nr:PI-PLC X domain-containing protein 3 [Neocloeon triangulifer]
MAGEWMGRLPDKAKDVPFFRLAIPGTHDSLSYTISASAPLAPDCPTAVRKMEKMFGAVTRSILYNWSVTQRLKISDQLRHGIRYLDLRVAMPVDGRDRNSQPLVVHHLCGTEIGPLLAEVDAFLSAFDQEVVVLDFQHFYNFTSDDHTQFIKHMQGLFGSRLCPYWPGAPEEITLRWMQALGHQIVLVYRTDDFQGAPGLWPGEALPSPWPNVREPRALIGFLERGLVARDKRRGHVSQCVLTPRTTTVVPAGMCSNLRRGLVRKCNQAVVPWLGRQSAGTGGINVAIADFVGVDGCAFVETIVQLNFKKFSEKSR